MNPFIESTVAHPVSKSHPDCQWDKLAADNDVRPFCSVSGDDNYAGRKSGDQPRTGTRPARLQRSDVTVCSGAKSAVAVISLSVGLALTALSGSTPGPAFVAGTAVVLGALMPRAAMAVDLNSATVQELQAVSGIGPKTAQTIVDERTRAGRFTSLSDLSDRVKGIGPKKAAALQTAGLKVNSDSGTAKPAGASGAAQAPGTPSRR